jgi:hypothetical protein
VVNHISGVNEAGDLALKDARKLAELSVKLDSLSRGLSEMLNKNIA